MKLPEKVIKLAKSVAKLGKGSRAFLVGGCVRDMLMGIESKDIDIEVYGVQPNKLREILESLGKIDAVGSSFQVYKLDNEIDVSIPRRERKVGKTHRDFVIEGDPFMSIEEASKRRDFTFNAMSMDILTNEIHDPFNGQKHIKEKLIVHIDDKTFIEDSLRVLRACQFAARFNFGIDPKTVDICREIDLSHLSKERIREELFKLLLAKEPCAGFIYLSLLTATEKLFPEIENLKDIQQDPIWHPEGDVYIHTLMVINEASKLTKHLSYEEKLTVMLAALCHDFGKPETTKMIDGRWRARGHEETGIEPTKKFLDRLGIYTIDGFDIRNQVLLIVANHLAPPTFYKAKSSNSAFRRLATKGVRMDLLNLVSRADVLGRYKNGVPAFTTEAHDWFDEKINNLDIKEKGPDKLLMGRHLIQLGMQPSAKFGWIIDKVYEMQLEGEVVTQGEAIQAAQHMISQLNIT